MNHQDTNLLNPVFGSMRLWCRLELWSRSFHHPSSHDHQRETISDLKIKAMNQQFSCSFVISVFADTIDIFSYLSQINSYPFLKIYFVDRVTISSIKFLLQTSNHFLHYFWEGCLQHSNIAILIRWAKIW